MLPLDAGFRVPGLAGVAVESITGDAVLNGANGNTSWNTAVCPSRPAALYLCTAVVRSMSRSNDRLNVSNLFTSRLSTTVHGATLVTCTAAYCDGSLFRAIHAFTPSAYAPRSAWVSDDNTDRLRSTVRRSPNVRSWTSLGNALLPSSSASVPDPVRRRTSIWNSRSSACTQPCRKNRSCALCALM